MNIPTVLASLLLLAAPVAAQDPAPSSHTLLLEAEAFDDLGGWVLDQQFMDQMGSPFLLAHGLGEPVRDATTRVRIPAAGQYRVWVRTRDWVAPWGAGGLSQFSGQDRAPSTDGRRPPENGTVPLAPGRFHILFNGKPLAATFGTEGAAWHWQHGGRVDLPAGEATVALHDLTGFDGRCDAILLSTDKHLSPPDSGEELARFRRRLLGITDKHLSPPDSGDELARFRRRLLGIADEPADGGRFDLVVVGGGIAGMTAAVSAARLGLDVALVNDRPVLGGCNSSEVRVWLGGEIQKPPYPHVGDVVGELEPRRKGQPGTADMYEDDKRLAFVRAEPRVRLALNQHVNRVEMASGRIAAVVAEDIRTARRTRFRGRWFADCTGDATVGFLAGADFDMTLEGHMGPSNMWSVEDTGRPAAFPRCPWAVNLYGKPLPTRLGDLGVWFWESGFDRHPIDEAERMRDTNLRAMYGAWDALKNDRKLYPRHRLLWAAYVAGKRESRRLLGDMVLSREDLLRGRSQPDGCVPTSWSIDLHLADPRYSRGFEEDPFLSHVSSRFEQYPRPYWIPYRCLYSRNVTNLWMAGRNVSVTHEALGTARVMRTTGMMGEIVGMAAAVCKRMKADPRAVYETHLDELKGLMRRGAGKKATGG